MGTSRELLRSWSVAAAVAVISSLSSICLGDFGNADDGGGSTEPELTDNDANSQTNPGRKPDDASEVVSSSGGLRAASRLVIGIGPSDPYPFGTSGGGEEGSNSEVMFQSGEALSRFDCNGGSSTLAIEGSNMAVRRIGFWKEDSSSFLDNFGLGSGSKQADVWVTDGSVRVLSEDGKNEDSHVLLAALETPLPNGTRIEAGTVYDRDELSLVYDCRHEGTAIVELRLRAQASDDSSNKICLRWTKQCSTGWKNLNIEEGDCAGDCTVLEDGVIQPDWKKRMENEGTHQPVTKFVFSVEGKERLRRPMVYSNQKLLEVGLVGPLTLSEINEVGKDSVTLSVMYTCLFDGFADVTLMIEKATISDEEPEQLALTFRKTCGVAMFQHLDVFIRGEKQNKTRTKAVDQGRVLPGFARPCKGDEKAIAHPAFRNHQDQGDRCEAKPPVQIVAEKELRTVLELEIDSDAGEIPMFFPQADITYDNKVLKVIVLHAPISKPKSSTGKHASRNRKQTLSLKYTCFEDAESVIMVTLHVYNYKPINLAWRKACVEPKAKVGKALTAPQAIMVTMFVCGIIVLVACLVFAFSGESESPQHTKKGPYNRAAIEDSGDGDLELPRKVLGKQEEVVFHS
jgi:hypothetical protein